MFKNAFVYRIEQWTPPTLSEMEERLHGARFVECAASQPESAGWVAPRGEAHAALAESVAGQVVFRLRTETKAVPGSVVKVQVQERLAAIERETGRRPKGKRARELKEAVVHELLPRAFPKRSEVLVWLDPVAGQVWVGAGSVRKADAAVSRLVELLAPARPGAGEGLKLSQLQTARSPATAMAAWLADKEAPAGFSIDRDCELRQPDSEKATVRYARHTLDIDEVAAHIAQGKLPTQLAMTWNGRVSFVLTEALALKRIELLDVVLQGTDATAAAGQEDGGFDADVAIASGELRQMMAALIEALGGVDMPQAERAGAAAAAPRAGGTERSLPPWEAAAA